MSEIPTISVTKDYDDELSDDERDDYNIKDAHTDIEDLDDSSIGDTSLKVKNLKTKKSKSSPATTDIEDYNDSSSDDEKSDQISDIPISLTEFLDHDHVEEEFGASNTITMKTSNKKGSRFLSYLEDDLGCVTDCENMDSSGDEVSIASDKEADVSISAYLPEQDNIIISDQLAKKIGHNYEENDSPISVSDAGDFCNPNEISDAEDFLVSDVEEDNIVFLQAYGLSRSKKELTTGEPLKEELPQSPCRSPMSFLAIADIEEDILTDIERLDMDTDEEIIGGVELYVVPQPVSHRPSLTDSEDMDLGDTTDLLGEPQQVSAASLPVPVREITIVTSDISGQRVASTKPLQGNIDMGIADNYDTGLTDAEEVSGAEEDYYENKKAVDIEQIPDVHNAVTKNSESIKVTTVRRNEGTAVCEPVTDVEEIFIPGTVRRKKSNKSKNQTRSKKLLDVRAQDKQATTDVEEIEISDVEATNKTLQVLQVASTSRIENESPDLKTDIEYVSGDDEYSVSEGDDENACGAKAINETSFYSTVTTMESISQVGRPNKRPAAREAIYHPGFETTMSNQNVTDIEDFNLPSDVEENLLNVASYSRADTVSPYELQDALNDSSVSVVHEKCGNAFDIDKEKQYIKGLRDCSDAHTDVEYLEDENDIGKENNQPRK